MADYSTTAKIKAQAAAKASATSDALIAQLITAASKAIDNFTNRPDGYVAGVAAVRSYAGLGQSFLRIDECAATPTLVAVKDSPTDSTYTNWAATDWMAARGDPENPDFNHLPYDLLIVDPTGNYSHWTSGRYTYLSGFRPDPDSRARSAVKTVQVTAQWGYATACPTDIEQACIIQVVRWLKRSEGSWADTLQAIESGQLLFRQSLDPDVKQLLVAGGYMRVAI